MWLLASALPLARYKNRHGLGHLHLRFSSHLQKGGHSFDALKCETYVLTLKASDTRWGPSMLLLSRVSDSRCCALILSILGASLHRSVYVDVSAGITENFVFYLVSSTAALSFCCACLLFYLDEGLAVPSLRRP